MVKAVIAYIGKKTHVKAFGSKNKKESKPWEKEGLKNKWRIKKINAIKNHQNIWEYHQKGEIKRKEKYWELERKYNKHNIKKKKRKERW